MLQTINIEGVGAMSPREATDVSMSENNLSISESQNESGLLSPE